MPEPCAVWGKGNQASAQRDEAGIAEKAVPQQVIKHSYMNPELWFPKRIFERTVILYFWQPCAFLIDDRTHKLHSFK